MPKLFNIEGFCRSETHISVYTDKGEQWVSRSRFEKWVDDRDKRQYEEDSSMQMNWQYYYTFYAEFDLYEYLVLKTQGSALLDIPNAINKCLN